MNVTPLQSWIQERTHLARPSQEALRAYQLEKVQTTLRYAQSKSRFYRERLGEIDVDAIDSFKTFETIAFTTPEDIRHNAYDFLCVPTHEIERIVTLNTSGTTGDEKRLFFTHEDLETTIDFFHYGMRCLVDERDKVMVLLPGPSFASIGDLLKKALQRSGIECIVHGVLDDVEAAAACIFQNGITAIVGIPMQVSYLARMKKELFDTHIKKVLLSTDYVADALVKSLSRNGTCQVFNHYGMTEMGYGGGVECACLSGYHLRENDLYFEIVDPMTGKVVEDGTYGEVVFTTLNRQAMPLIRYKTGDRARFLVEPCACGTFLRRMEKVRGRIENTLSVEGHEITLRDLDEIFLAYESLMDYRVECYDPNRLHVRLVLDKNTDAKAFQNALKQELHVRFQSKFDFEIEIEEDDRSSKITRSMIKRKIHDCRQGAKR